MVLEGVRAVDLAGYNVEQQRAVHVRVYQALGFGLGGYQEGKLAPHTHGQRHGGHLVGSAWERVHPCHQLAQRRRRHDGRAPNHLGRPEVPHGHLKPDGGGEKEAREPCDGLPRLLRPHLLHRRVGAPAQSREERPQKVAAPGVVGGVQQRQHLRRQHQQHRLGLHGLRDARQNVSAHELWKHQNHEGPDADEEEQRREQGSDHLGQGGIVQRLQLAQHDEREHVVHHRGGDDHLPHRLVQHPSGLEDVEGDAGGGGGESQPAGQRAAPAQRETKVRDQERDADGAQAARHRRRDSPRPDDSEPFDVHGEPGVHHQQHQTEFAKKLQRRRLGGVVEQVGAQNHACQ
mmetsp:Transcript_7805/g.14768  ORF Transcript_7805/g.14768 Transcript_7805/m.14768 type:complete len:346 (+) Transcript_7805:1018-2055(+)